MRTPRTAVVIGGGISGLATANLLAHDGWEVTLLERNSTLGGRAGWLEIDGFSFDTGPSWYLMAEVFEHYFALLGRRVEDYYTIRRLDPAYRVFSESVPPMTIHSDLDRDARTFDELEPGAGEELKRYIKRAEASYKLALENFLYTNFDSPKALASTDIIRNIGALPRTTSLNKFVSSKFKHPVLRQILQYHSVFLGASPFRAPSLYSLMAYLDFMQGVFYPEGGMYQIILALEKIGRELGVTYRTRTEVRQIMTKAGVATGVVLTDGRIIEADLVVSAADLHHTEQALLPKAERSYSDTFWRRAKPSPSALLMYLGVEGRVPELAHHNLIFTSDLRRNFSDVFDDGVWPEPASMYVSAPSRTDSTVAPKGDENLFILIPVPAGVEISEADQIAAAEAYLAQLEVAIGVPDLRRRIKVKRLFGPADFASEYNSWQGNALGLGHTWGQSAIFRPQIKSKRLDNLYYVGANTRPGVGLPMCLISAELVSKSLRGDRSAGPTRVPGKPIK